MKKRILILGLGVLTTLTMISFTAKETKNTFTETDKVGMVFT